MAHSCHDAMGDMKGDEGQEICPWGWGGCLNSTCLQNCCEHGIETSHWQAHWDRCRAWSLSQLHPCHLPSDLGTSLEERKFEVIRWARERLWSSGSSVWVQSITVCDWWASFFLGIASESWMKWFPPPLTSGGLTSEGSGRETIWE